MHSALTEQQRRLVRDWLLERVPASGATIGNVRLREMLAELAEREGFMLSEGEYWLSRDQLIEQGILAAGRGRGGSVYRLSAVQSATNNVEEEEDDEIAWEDDVDSTAQASPNLAKLRSRLLDLSARNRLLNFSHNRGKRFVRIVDELPNQLFETLLSDRDMRFEAVPEPTQKELINAGYIKIDPTTRQEVALRKYPTAEVWAQHLGIATEYELPTNQSQHDDRHQDSSIQTICFPPELETRLQRLYSESRSALEETGANILFIALGFLEWEESVIGKNSTRQAPLMLIPVQLERGELNRETSTYEYRVKYTGEDILTNLSLREKLKHDFSIALPVIKPSTKPESYFKSIVETVLEVKPEWKVRRFASLGLFEFGKLMMYLDLDAGRWPDAAIVSHPLVDSLTGAMAKPVEDEGDGREPVGFQSEHAIDSIDEIHTKYTLIDDADSSQHSALIDVINGNNLVIEGPPGTGKSQTITNMIAAALNQGKKVLFVAEKKAALDVVKSRLTKAGLGNFCLELHSHKTQKQAVIASIGERLAEKGKYPSPNRLSQSIETYERLKSRLNDHVRLLNGEWKDSGYSLHQILIQAARLREALKVPGDAFHPSSPTDLPLSQVADQARFFAGYFQKTAAEAGVAGQLPSHPWFGVQQHTLTSHDQKVLINELDRVGTLLDAIGQKSNALIGVIGIADNEELTLVELEHAASGLSRLQAINGDEDWNLLPKLNLESAVEFCDWLDQVDQLFAMHQDIAQKVAPAALKEDGAYQELKRATTTLRQHTNIENLSLIQLKTCIEGLSSLLNHAPRIQVLLSRIKAVELKSGHKHLTTDLTGLRQLVLLLTLGKALPQHLVSKRHPRLEDERVEACLTEIKRTVRDLTDQRARIARSLNVEALPSPQALEDIERVLADASIFRWFKSEWRDARRQLKAVTRPGVKLPDAVAAAAEAAIFRTKQSEFLESKRHHEILGELFSGLETDTDSLLGLCKWHRQVLAACGRGFGHNAWLTDWLNLAPGESLSYLSAEAAELQLAIEELIRLLLEIEALLPFDSNGIQTEDLLSPQGLVVRLEKELGTALSTLAAMLRIQNPTLAELTGLVRQVEEWREQAQRCRSNPAVNACLGTKELSIDIANPDAQAKLASWRHTAQLVRQVVELPFGEQVLAQLCLHDIRAAQVRVEEWRGSASDILKVLGEFTDAKNRFIHLGQIAASAWWGDENSLSTTNAKERISLALSRKDLLEHWIEYCRLRQRLVGFGFECVVEAVETGSLDSGKAESACRLGIVDSWARAILNKHPELEQFSGKEQEAIQARFAEIDTELKQLQRQKVAAQIDQHKIPMGINSGKVKERTELFLLEHEVSKQRRHEPIRALMSRAAGALQALMPCFMMSPMAVSQYLPAGRVKFDLVVMDEASQLRPEEALGSIARGKQVVVVGDPKQLPPTNFFSRQSGDDDAEGEDLSLAQDSESILDAAMPLFRLRRLRWHYRSKHQDLIAFSNSAFYDSNLVIYPSPHSASAEFGIRNTRVPHGRFVDQRNTEEAEIIVKAIEHHVLNSDHESLGVVAMNIKQADLIETMLEQRTKDDGRLLLAVEKARSSQEPLFIKNLENVQGDERDVIFISGTYGPMESGGRVPQRFGPINGQDGWRRLNVLFTRSKKRMHLFSSFGSGDVLVSNTSSRGVKALRDFLAFAESGAIHRVRESARAADSDFEIAVREALSEHGFECEPQIGVAGFFIDLAVRDPNLPGRYLMGIECDGASYHSAKSARDRDRLRQHILEQLGWKIRRIWSVDWYRNPRAQLAPLIAELSTLKSASRTVAPEQTSDEFEYIENEVEQAATHLREIAPTTNGMSLREKLAWFDESVIRKEFPNSPPGTAPFKTSHD